MDILFFESTSLTNPIAGNPAIARLLGLRGDNQRGGDTGSPAAAVRQPRGARARRPGHPDEEYRDDRAGKAQDTAVVLRAVPSGDIK